MKKYALLFTALIFIPAFSMQEECRQKSCGKKMEDIIFSLARALQNNEHAMNTLFIAANEQVAKR